MTIKKCQKAPVRGKSKQTLTVVKDKIKITT